MQMVWRGVGRPCASTIAHAASELTVWKMQWNSEKFMACARAKRKRFFRFLSIQSPAHKLEARTTLDLPNGC